MSNNNPTKSLNALWAGRLTSGVDPVVQRYTRSLHVDRRLADLDLRGSRAHVRMLARQGIVSPGDRDKILTGLDRIEQELADGSFPFRDELEDIHMNIEHRLKELSGEAGERLHTGRSRNDQVALDVKLFCLGTAQDWRAAIRSSLAILVTRAEEFREDLYPAWTHLQAAQPLSWGHYLLAFAEMLHRDQDRLSSYSERHSVCPLGAGALSGSSLPLDPSQTAQELGFREAFANSYDVVGDRDMILELLQIATQLMLHLSRLAEDFIYLSSTPVGWIDLPDSLCTGSSMMPQKKNPDLLELMRGKTASVLGHSQAIAVLLKGLPSSYNRDLQQDKEHLFACVDIVSDSLEVLQVLLDGFSVNRERSRAALDRGFLMATELAEYLVGKGLPFRTAHHKVGALVAFCAKQGVSLEELPIEQIREQIPECSDDVRDALRPESALDRRTCPGSTGRRSIEIQLERWKEKLACP